MAFLDNSGDIILDAVLTDVGRMRLARGDGTFKITKFALGDDEINYARFQLNHPSGSAYSDLEILQTPVLEAFTNNVASMTSKLITIPRDNVLFLPVVTLNEVFSNNTRRNSEKSAFVIAVDSTTEQEFAVNSSNVSIDGILFGENPRDGGNYIRLDQGLNTTQISPARALDRMLAETRYMIEMDNRLGTIVSPDDAFPAQLSYIDDDQIATYSVSLTTNPNFVKQNSNRQASANEVIAGPRGTMLSFKVLSSLELNTNTYLFTTLGSTETLTGRNGSVSVRSITTTIRVVGGTTGYRIDIPVKFVKKV
jgi:hypothetical protein